MRKLLIFWAAIILCAGCENYQADIDTYLSYWSTQAAIVRSAFDPAITVRTDKDTIQSIPSSSNVTITFTVRNPKNFKFKLPRDAGAPTDIVVFPTDVAGTTTSSPKQPDDYELTQDSYSQLTLTYKKEFLQKHEYGKKNIGPTITLYAKDGRKFSETFKLNVKANTPPPNLIYRAIGKTAAADVNGKHYYVLFLEVSGMDTEINGSDLLHKDITQLSIAEGSGSYTSIPLTVKADKSGFDISGASGRLLEYSNAAALELVDVESGVTPDILPASTEKWILCVKTDVEVRGAVKQYRIRLQDEAGLFSEDELVASTSINKVSPVHIDVHTGNWTTTMKSGSEANPHEIVYQPGTGKVLLRVSTATTGATVYYKLECNSSVVSKSSGQTPQTIELPAVPDAVYKLTVWAEKEGYDKTSDVVVCYKTKRTNGLEISAGPNAWGQLKAAVAAAEDGDIFLVNGSIQATNDAGNSGAIEVTKSITIKGKHNNANTDMLDANKSGLGAGAHRIFNVNSGTLTLENLTLKNGKAAGGGEAGNGGAMLIESGGTLTMTGCVVQECTATANGGGILNKGILTINHGRIESNEANAGGGIYNEGTLIINNGIIGKDTSGNANHATSSGGGIFLYQGACTLNGTKIKENTLGGSGKGSGIYLHQPKGAALTITGGTQIGNSTDTNTLCLGAQSPQIAFVTAKDLNSTAHINMEPQEYFGQKNKTLVKVPADASAVAYKGYFHLTSVPTAEIWELVPDSQNEALILKQAEVINNVGNSWQQLKTAVAGAEEGDIIVIDGMIKATSSGNFGEIAVTKSITIRGKSGNRDTDVLDANKTTGGKAAHRIFKVTNCDLTLEGLTLKGGMAVATDYDGQLGGGIYGENLENLTIKNCIIKDCEAKESGGGIYVKEASSIVTEVAITDTVIQQNQAAKQGGGITFIPSGSGRITGMLERVTVKGNSLTSTDSNTPVRGGAGIFLSGGYDDSLYLTVKGGSIEDNNAGNFNGGGIYIVGASGNKPDGTLTLTDGARISGNSAENGGGVAVHSAKLIIEPGCTIGGGDASKGNEAKTSGGGISVGEKGVCIINEDVTIQHNTVTNGIAVMNGGGGLHIYGTSSPADSGTVTITGTQDKPVRIADNEVRGSTGVGGGIANNGTITLTHVHISGCKAPDSAGLGGGIYVRRGACTLIDSNVTGCKASGAGGGVYVYKGGGEAGEFTMQSSTRIVPSANNDRGKNDIFLRDGACIKLSGGLTGERSVGRITVPDGNYNPSTQVLDGNITVDGNYKKFTVTPKGSTQWYVGSNGALTTTQPSP